ncbi:GIY-YIG nuclease family protein [Bacillus sp. AFS096315]|uniref:GIY-YIG nuclease family protein n=1 Tax=Bacillus sp. AFS096315 TaxID=2033517 RepID=UPI000BED73B1|nr:GIY-YIG nuclease family protein [Bacillus sp. AFS096315]PEC46380.1 hypothetical protein CON00_23960 [Bacillus sp. AFS096315]
MSINLGSAEFSMPEIVRTDWHAWMDYNKLTDKTVAVYILRGYDNEVLYVGYSSQLRKRLESHLYGKFNEEIKSIEYIENQWEGNKTIIEIEKILYFFLKPKYCNKKILPTSLYQMNRIENYWLF